MKDAFIEEFPIRYSDFDDKLTLRPSHLIDIMQNIASSHSNEVGYDMSWFQENHRAWLLTFWHIRIDSLPNEEGNLSCKTWSEPYKNIQAQRDFILEDKKGNQIAYGTSRWVLIDTKRKRPTKVDKKFYKAYEFENKRPLWDQDEKAFFPEEEGEQLQEFSFVVTRKDIDTNGHVNNTVYVDWAIDRVPEGIYEDYKLQEIAVSYKKECKKDVKIKVISNIKEIDDNKKLITSKIVNDEDAKILYCKVSTIWG